MKEVKVVIGGNYGDEGKGLMTHYFCSKSIRQRQQTIVVLTNGGAQRGHTVVTPFSQQLNNRHVFHHFGSGTFAYADSYFASTFILNPIIFRQEYNEVLVGGRQILSIITHPECRVSTPFDMMLNQIIEESRGDDRHGSCGLGIWETILRCNDQQRFSTDISYLERLDVKGLKNILTKIRDEYSMYRLKEVGIEIPPVWEEVFFSETLIDNYIDDLLFMISKVRIATEEVITAYDCVVFENGQGLLLDNKYGDHATPSATGLEIPSKIISSFLNDYHVEVCYVTRTYLTRHGAGILPNEVDVSDINPDIYDLTNVFNPWQGYIRYAHLDAESFTQRTDEDFHSFAKDGWIKSVAVTHINEHDVPDGLKYNYWSDSEVNVCTTGL